jgi:hypothetical protein
MPVDIDGMERVDDIDVERRSSRRWTAMLPTS